MSAAKEFDPENEVLIFSHIPKTGGGSVNAALSAGLGEKYYHVKRGAEPSIPLQQVWASGGHQLYGQNPLSGAERTPVYVTMLREPLSRLFSMYNYVKRVETHPLRQVDNADNMTFMDFLKILEDKRPLELINMQSQYISGFRDMNDCPDSITSLLEGRFRFFAPMEFSNIFFDSLSRYLGVEIGNRERNVTKSTAHWQNISEDEVRKVYENNMSDLDLYQYAYQAFVRKLIS